jgi:hypothetical protein
VDLGTKDSVYQGETKKKRRLFFVWELTAEADSEGRNFVVGQDYTYSLKGEAKLKEVVKGFRNKAVQPGEEYEFADMLLKPVMVGVGEGLSKAGKKFVSVTGLSQPPKGFAVPPATYTPFMFHWDAVSSTKDVDGLEVPDWMPRIYGVPLVEELKTADQYGNLSPF